MEPRDLIAYYYNKNIEAFLDHMANGNYVGAKEVMPKMISHKINLIIAPKREEFLKQMAEKTKNKAKES